jgi:plastocyanin
MTKRSRRAIVAGVFTAIALWQAVPASAATTVQARCDYFSPATKSIYKGTKVIWKSVCDAHTVTSYGSNWSKNTTLQQGQTTSKTFTSNGKFKYRCRFHSKLENGVCSGMCGKVVVG